MKNLGVIALLIVSFAMGYAWIWKTQDRNQMVYLTPKSSRVPAAIRKVYDFSALDGSALNKASKQRLIAGFEVMREAESVGVRLGHFVVADAKGDKVFACDLYTRVLLSFEGEGVATNGDKPVMEIEGACAPDQDINRISPLWIPVARIMGSPVADGEFSMAEETNPASEGIRIRFRHVSDQWPQQWALAKVKLLHEKTGNAEDEVTIEQEELRSMMDRPVVIEF